MLKSGRGRRCLRQGAAAAYKQSNELVLGTENQDLAGGKCWPRSAPKPNPVPEHLSAPQQNTFLTAALQGSFPRCLLICKGKILLDAQKCLMTAVI